LLKGGINRILERPTEVTKVLPLCWALPLPAKRAEKQYGAGAQMRWIHDFLYVEQFQKIIMAFDDNQISIYEALTLDKFRVLDLQTSNPLCLDFHCSEKEKENSMLVFGTDQGYTNVFYFNNS
jgi:hypothetical protein